jgi:hypothetical protein
MQHPEDQEQPPVPHAPEPDSSETSPEPTPGQIGGAYDAEPGAPAAPAPISPRKRKRGEPAPETPAAQAPAGDERLALPRGGLVAMRKSGGMRFSTREIVVYRSGKLTYRQSGVGSAPIAQTRHLPLAQLVELHHALNQSDLARLPAPIGRQSGDTFAYEIVARVGRAVKAVEVFEGSVPASLAPLIRELRGLMPEDEG